MKRCVGVWWLSGRRQGTCRPLTDATLWRTGALQIFWEDFGAGPLNGRGGLCKKRQSFAQPTHGPQARHLSPKKERTKKFTFAHKRIHLHRKPPTKGVHLYNESPQNNHLRIQKRPNPRAAATSPVYCTTQNSPASSMPEQTSEAFTGMNTKKSAGKASSTV